MSLIPSSVQGAPNDPYFVAVDDGVLRAPTILPAEVLGAAAAALSISNAVTDPSLNPMEVVHYVPAVAGGGLTPGLYQVFMYGPSIGGAFNTAQLFSGRGLGNGSSVLAFNNGGPLEATRMGQITGTGAAQVVAVPSITAASIVRLAFVAGTAAAANPVITIVPNTSFSLTLPLNAVYNYEVIA